MTTTLVTERGSTTIAPSVVGKIAVRAAGEVTGVGAVSRSGLSRLLRAGRPSDRVDVEVERETAVIDLGISVRYPQPVARVTDEVRRHVIERVRELTGLEVVEVNLDVEELALDGGGPRRRVD